LWEEGVKKWLGLPLRKIFQKNLKALSHDRVLRISHCVRMLPNPADYYSKLQSHWGLRWNQVVPLFDAEKGILNQNIGYYTSHSESKFPNS